MPELAEGARLEIVCTSRYRGFESLSLRQNLRSKFWRDLTKSKQAFGGSARRDLTLRRRRSDGAAGIPLEAGLLVAYND